MPGFGSLKWDITKDAPEEQRAILRKCWLVLKEPTDLPVMLYCFAWLPLSTQFSMSR